MNKKLNLNNNLLKNIALIVIFPIMCIVLNYSILTVLWLGRYLGTFFRLVFRIVC